MNKCSKSLLKYKNKGKNHGFSLFYLSNKKTPIVIGIALTVFAMCLVTNYSTLLFSNFITETHLNNYAKLNDIPDVSDFISKDILAEYVKKSETLY